VRKAEDTRQREMKMRKSTSWIGIGKRGRKVSRRQWHRRGLASKKENEGGREGLQTRDERKEAAGGE